MADKGIAQGAISGSGRDGRVLKQDVISALAAGFDPAAVASQSGWSGSREIRREKMSMLRRKVAERLVGVKNDTAMLTTFNEVDMKLLWILELSTRISLKKKRSRLRLHGILYKGCNYCT